MRQRFTAEQVWRWTARTIVVGVVCPLIVWGATELVGFLRALDQTSTRSLAELVSIRAEVREWQVRQRDADDEQREYRRTVDNRFLEIASQLAKVVDRIVKVEDGHQNSTRQFTGPGR